MKKTTMKILNHILQWTWCLPQNIAGSIVYLIGKIQKAETEVYKDTIITHWKYSSGLSLGRFIFVPENTTENTIKHEYGHHIQSNMLGWFYLLVVGLPSIIWAGLFDDYRKKHNISYYSIFPENWADKLGGVERR